MKKLLSNFLIAGMVCVAFPREASAASSATFNITVTVNFLEMQIVQYDQAWDGTTYSAWGIGGMATSSTSTMAEADGVKVVLGSTSQTIDIQSYVSNEGAAWTVDTTAAADKYAIMAKGYNATQASPSVASGTQLTTSAQDVTDATAIASGADTWLYYDFDSPTSVATGTQQTIVITVAIVVA